MAGLKSTLIAMPNVNAAQLRDLHAPLMRDDAMLLVCIEELDSLISHVLLVGRLHVSAQFLDWVVDTLTASIAQRLYVALQVPPFVESLTLTEPHRVLGYWVKRWTYEEVAARFPAYLGLFPKGCDAPQEELLALLGAAESPC